MGNDTRAEKDKKGTFKDYFEFLRKATDTVIEAVKWPGQARKIERQFAKKQDELEEVRDRLADKVLDIEKKLTTASEDEMGSIIKSGVQAMIELDAAKRNAAVAKEWYAKLKGPAPAEATQE